MKNRFAPFILFIDSGMGGISILDYLLKKKRNLNVVYYADNKNFPYGTKDETTIGGYLLDIYNRVSKKYNIELIVLACNTASVSALDYLRGKISVPIVGTVPAVKVASELTINNRIGIIATETTVKLDYLSNLVKNFASDKEVFVKASKKLVEVVENDYSYEEKSQIIREELSYFLEKDIDTLVLGCTHYSFLYEEIESFFEKRVKIVDSREGVSNRVLRLIPDSLKDLKTFDVRLYLSMNNLEIREKYKKINEKLGIFHEIPVLE